MNDYIIGLDLGQAQDPTALAVLERPERSEEERGWSPTYAVRHLERFPLGTAYTAIVPAVVKLCTTKELKGSPLVIDQTGVGRALVAHADVQPNWPPLPIFASFRQPRIPQN